MFLLVLQGGAFLLLFGQQLFFFILNLSFGLFNTGHLLLAVRPVRLKIIYPLQGIIEIIGGKYEIQKIITASVLVGIHHTAGILGLQGVELYPKVVYLYVGEIDIIVDSPDLAVDVADQAIL